MESIFRLFRVPLVPIPVVLWTILWPILILALILIIPIALIAVALLRCAGLPFIFLYSAFNEDTSAWNRYLANWNVTNGSITNLLSGFSVTKPYQTIFDWLTSPKKNGGSGEVIFSNIFGVAGAASIYSETIRVAIFILIGVVVALYIWAES